MVAKSDKKQVWLVKYSGIFECEAETREQAETMFEDAGDGLMANGTVGYHAPLTETEWEEREARSMTEAQAHT
jgi:hypothetical protein